MWTRLRKSRAYANTIIFREAQEARLSRRRERRRTALALAAKATMLDVMRWIKDSPDFEYVGYRPAMDHAEDEKLEMD